MKIGKLTNEQLYTAILSELGQERSDIVLRPGVGEDCGGILFGDEICVLSTDPITVASEGAGALAMQVSVNDVASSGAEAIAALLTILAPPESGIEQIAAIVKDAHRQAQAENIEIIGGHTEITDAVNRIVLSVTVVGRVTRKKLLHTAGAQIGDEVVMTKYAAIEGTRILLGKDGESLSPMLSIVPEARIAADMGAHAMHDATEGGVLGAAWELAEAAGLGVDVYADQIQMLPVTEQICREKGLDPLRLISSGSLLIAHPNGQMLASALKKRGIDAAVIGRLTAQERVLIQGSERTPLSPPQSDEIYRA